MAPLMCLVAAVYFEARSEPLEGQYAVAEVVMNRVESSRYPNSICGVISQDLGPLPMDCQFTFMCDGKPETMHDEDSAKTALAVATNVMNGTVSESYAEDALWYHADYVSPHWSKKLFVVSKHGKHIFFTDTVILADNTLD